MSAHFKGVLEAIKDAKPDQFWSGEKDVPVESWVRRLRGTTDDNFIPEEMTEKVYTFVWRWSRQKISVVIETHQEEAYDSNTQQRSLFVKHDEVTVLSNDAQVTLPTTGSRLRLVTYSIDNKTDPKGLIELLRAMQTGTVAVSAA